MTGRNNEGQLGLGNNEEEKIVSQWRGLKSEVPFIQISSGENHTLGLCEDGSAWSWGLNERGELGFGDKKPRYQPSKIPFQQNVKHIQSGYQYSSLITGM